jgi:hypothetical protein
VEQLRHTFDAPADLRFPAFDTITTIARWAQRLLGPNARREDLARILDWAANARLIIKPPGGTFSDQYADGYGIFSSAPLSLTTYSRIPFGVNIDPWMSLAGSSKAAELNLAELNAVLSQSPSDTDGLLFPDSVRLEPEQKHRDAFAVFMISRGESASNYRLLYVRYFVGAARANGIVSPRPRIAYAYLPQQLSAGVIINFGPAQ